MNKTAQTPSAWAQLQQEWFSLSFFPEKNEQQSFHYRACSVKGSSSFASAKPVATRPPRGSLQWDVVTPGRGLCAIIEMDTSAPPHTNEVCEWGILINSPVTVVSSNRRMLLSNTIVAAFEIALSVTIMAPTTCLLLRRGFAFVWAPYVVISQLIVVVKQEFNTVTTKKL